MIETRPVWMTEAWSNLGAHERPGLESDPKIKAWADEFKIENFNEDTDPYCALFPRWCFHKTMPNEPLPSHPKWAMGWLRFGVPCAPRYGAVLVFYRGDPAKQIGHVGYDVGETETDFAVLGANQSDAVSVRLMPKARLLGCRWPIS